MHLTKPGPRRVISLLIALILASALLAACGTSSRASASSSAHTTVYEWGKPGGGPSERHPQGTSTNPAGQASTTAAIFDRSGRSGAEAEHSSPTPIAGIQGTVVQISTSNSDSYALTSTGTVWAWGAGGTGELGNGTRSVGSAAAVQVDFPPGVHITSLPDPMPYDGGLAIDGRGQAWGWGDDTYHQLCLSSTQDLDKPTLLPVPHVTLAAGASRHTIFDSAGRIEGCGWNKNGDLGDGSTAGVAANPTPVRGLPSLPVKAVTAAWGNEGVLLADGTFYDWGFNRAGQAGDGSTTAATKAVRVALPHPATQVSEGASVAGNGTTLAILSDGSTWVWGDGSQGQLGDGTTGHATSPKALALPPGVRFTQVNSGGATCYGLDQQGRMWAWGDDRAGQLGSGSTSPSASRPVDVGIHLAQVSSTAANVAGLARSG